MPSLAEIGLGVAVAAGLVIGIGYLARVTGAGQGIAQLGTGIQTGLSAILSPQITPTFEPTLGLNLQLGGNVGQFILKSLGGQ